MLLFVPDHILTTEINTYILPYIYIIAIVKGGYCEQTLLLLEEF